MGRTYSYQVEKENHGASVKDVLKSSLGVSSRIYKKLKDHQAIFKNGQPVKGHSKLSQGDEVSISFAFEKNTYPIDHGPIGVVYEDEDLLVINKEPGTVMHPTNGYEEGTLLNRVGGYQLRRNQSYKIRFVNRLDQDTSGIVICAKTPLVHYHLSELMQGDKVTKEYVTLVNGHLQPRKGLIEAPIGPVGIGSPLRVVTDQGKYCKTGYEVIEEIGDYDLVKVRLYTGRTHQIRVHMAHLGHPVVGDALYGGEMLLERQFLHCAMMRFQHPISKKDLTLEAPLPKELLDFLGDLTLKTE